MDIPDNSPRLGAELILVSAYARPSSEIVKRCVHYSYFPDTPINVQVRYAGAAVAF